MSIKGKTVLVIGGSSGIGLSIADLCIKKGAKVTIASRSRDKLEKAKKKLSGDVDIAEIDLLSETSIKTFFNNIGFIDHLQLPGSEVRFGGIDDLSLEDARYSFDSKFWGPFTSIKYSKNQICDQGSITLFSGAASQRPTKDSTILTSLNTAVESLSRALAISLSPIRVNVISPGITMTPLFQNMPDEDIARIYSTYEKSLLVKRFGEPEEVAMTAIYLMENNYVTGSLQIVDGGLGVT